MRKLAILRVPYDQCTELVLQDGEQGVVQEYASTINLDFAGVQMFGRLFWRPLLVRKIKILELWELFHLTQKFHRAFQITISFNCS